MSVFGSPVFNPREAAAFHANHGQQTKSDSPNSGRYGEQRVVCLATVLLLLRGIYESITFEAVAPSRSRLAQ